MMNPSIVTPLARDPTGCPFTTNSGTDRPSVNGSGDIGARIVASGPTPAPVARPLASNPIANDPCTVTSGTSSTSGNSSADGAALGVVLPLNTPGPTAIVIRHAPDSSSPR